MVNVAGANRGSRASSLGRIDRRFGAWITRRARLESGMVFSEISRQMTQGAIMLEPEFPK
jgi:hypothetical protein